VLVGDWNWRPVYAGLLSEAWTLAHSGPTMVSEETSPTRCLLLGCTAEAAEGVPALGIPHHKVMTYITDVAATAERRPRTATAQHSCIPVDVASSSPRGQRNPACDRCCSTALLDCT
jgi:hypothetical protein